MGQLAAQSEPVCVASFARRRVLFGSCFGCVTTLIFKGDWFALRVSDRLAFAGVSVAAFARFGAALQTLKIDGVHTLSLGLAGITGSESKRKRRRRPE